jgi:hypothetical protein
MKKILIYIISVIITFFFFAFIIEMKSSILRESMVVAESQCIESYKKNVCIFESFLEKYDLEDGGYVRPSKIKAVLDRPDLDLPIKQVEVLEAYEAMLAHNGKFILYLLEALLISLVVAYFFTKFISKKLKMDI